MPKKSKRVAARQAELSKKKRKSPPRASSLYQGQAPMAPPTPRETSPTPVPEESPGTGTALPEFEVPQHVRPPEAEAGAAIARAPSPPRFSPRAMVGPTTGRRELPKAPYLKSDIRRIGLLAAGLLVLLVMLTLVVD